NLASQGIFGSGALHLAGLEPWGLLKVGVPHLDDIVNFLGRGIHFADIVNTVSERYAEEIQEPEYGEGMDALLARNRHKLHGIVNGIDTELFDPEHDPAVPHHYSAADPTSKKLNKEALRSVLGLADVEVPVVRATGGLVDTVRDYDPGSGEGTGFMFEEYDPWQLFAAVIRAAQTYRHQPTWEQLVRRDMAVDVSWGQSARRYIELYRTAIVSNRD